MPTERIELAPVVGGIIRLNDWLDAAFAQSQLDSDVAASFKLCLNEYVSNLINYAFGDTPQPSIVVEAEFDKKTGTATIIDNGCPFDLRQWPSPDKTRNLLTSKPGGFGIPLILERAAEIDYVREGDRNVLTLVCRRRDP